MAKVKRFIPFYIYNNALEAFNQLGFIRRAAIEKLIPEAVANNKGQGMYYISGMDMRGRTFRLSHNFNTQIECFEAMQKIME